MGWCVGCVTLAADWGVGCFGAGANILWRPSNIPLLYFLDYFPCASPRFSELSGAFQLEVAFLFYFIFCMGRSFFCGMLYRSLDPHFRIRSPNIQIEWLFCSFIHSLEFNRNRITARLCTRIRRKCTTTSVASPAAAGAGRTCKSSTRCSTIWTGRGSRETALWRHLAVDRPTTLTQGDGPLSTPCSTNCPTPSSPSLFAFLFPFFLYIFN